MCSRLRNVGSPRHRALPCGRSTEVVLDVCADDELKVLIAAIFVDNYEVYGARKIKAALNAEHGLIARPRAGRPV